MSQLDLLDRILLLSEGKNRSLDCVLVFEFPSVPSLEKLKEGARKAQQVFPKTSRFEMQITYETDLSAFVNRPLKSFWHLEEAIIGNMLALKMSHVLGDAVSMVLFLKAQLGEKIQDSKISLHEFQAKKDSKYKGILPSEKWPFQKAGMKRSFFECSLRHDEQYGEFSINDLLSLALLKSLPVKKKALWIPVNVRKSPWEGFGNGLSRLRLYPGPAFMSFHDELQFLRKQKKEAWSSGELFLPPPDMDIDKPFLKQFLKLWINRPWADWGTISFSHLHDKDGRVPAEVVKVWGVTNIPDKLNAGLFAFTRKNETFLTLVTGQSKNKNSSDDLLKKLSDNFSIIKNSL